MMDSITASVFETIKKLNKVNESIDLNSIYNFSKRDGHTVNQIKHSLKFLIKNNYIKWNGKFRLEVVKEWKRIN